MAAPHASFCPRCAQQVEVVGVWPGYRWVKRGWYAGLLVICALMPILLSEITVLLPLAMVFALAAGPVHLLSAQRPSCRVCGLELRPSSEGSGLRRIE